MVVLSYFIGRRYFQNDGEHNCFDIQKAKY